MLELISFFWVDEYYELNPQSCIKQNNQWQILNQIFIDNIPEVQKFKLSQDIQRFIYAYH